MRLDDLISFTFLYSSCWELITKLNPSGNTAEGTFSKSVFPSPYHMLPNC